MSLTDIYIKHPFSLMIRQVNLNVQNLCAFACLTWSDTDWSDSRLQLRLRN